MRKSILLLFFVIGFFNAFAQKIEFSHVITNNRIVDYDNQKLILLDFWATWCGPCYPATMQLEIFQEINKDKVFVISISDENQARIEKFLIKHPIKLMVAIDGAGSIIQKYDINSRPFGVLLNQNGDLIWKGHPADLTSSLLNKLYEKNKNFDQNKLYDLIKVNNLVEKKAQKSVLTINEVNNTEENLLIDDENVIFSGKISTIMSDLKSMLKSDIEIDEGLNKNIELKCSKLDWNDKIKIEIFLLEKFNLEISSFQKEVLSKEIIIENEKLLWNTKQIAWDESAPSFMIGPDRIMVNDAGVAKFALILSENKNQYFVYKGNNNEKHDWDFQYLYDNLMEEELESSFGIKLKETTENRDFIKITKKK